MGDSDPAVRSGHVCVMVFNLAEAHTPSQNLDDHIVEKSVDYRFLHQTVWNVKFSAVFPRRLDHSHVAGRVFKHFVTEENCVSMSDAMAQL